MISPAMRLELGDVRSIRTATSSHSSPDVDVSEVAPGVPPNHHTMFRDVDDLWNCVLIILVWSAFLDGVRRRDDAVKASVFNPEKTKPKHT